MTQNKFTGGKFNRSDKTLDGSNRAYVNFEGLETLWFNTGTLCNIACKNCYIKSSPQNDSLVYLTLNDVKGFLRELSSDGHDTKQIGFTGGEPFMNPEIVSMTQICLQKGYQVLILTNAMRPMMRQKVKQKLLELNSSFGNQLNLRISLDHWSKASHDKERGKSSYDETLKGMRWLSENGLNMTIAGRALLAKPGENVRQEYSNLFAKHGFDIDAFNPSKTVLFPEMDETTDVPEITTSCWSILNKTPTDMMCSYSRMIVKRKGDRTPRVIACTLLPYEPEFELGKTLQDASKPVFLNHPHCAKFCVLGGASCSA